MAAHWLEEVENATQEKRAVMFGLFGVGLQMVYQVRQESRIE